MNTTELQPEQHRLTHQQQRFCDLYLTHFNAFKASVEAGYSENTSRKGALLHVPKIQRYLKERMAERSQRLEITHDMILRELSKIAFSNMGNYYDEHACLKRMNELTVDEKAAISHYDITEIQDAEGYRVGMQSRIKLHNKMSALDRIARHVGFYGVDGVGKCQVASIRYQDGVAVADEPEDRGLKREAIRNENVGDGLSVRTPTMGARTPTTAARTRTMAAREDSFSGEGHGADDTPLHPSREGNRTVPASAREAVVVDRSVDNLPMDYPVEDFELEGIDLKTLAALEEVNVSPGREFEVEESGSCSGSEKEGLEIEAGGLNGIRELTPPCTLPGEGIAQASRGDERVENILTISPLLREGFGGQGLHLMTEGLNDGMTDLRNDRFALRMGADTGRVAGLGQAAANA